MLTQTATGPAIGFITYHSGPSFYDRVTQVLRSGLPVYVFDNSPESTDAGRLLGTDSNGSQARVHYMTTGKNSGLGIGLATLCATAYAHGHDELLFFDQDTRFTDETLTHVRAFVGKELAPLKAAYAAILFCGPDPKRTDKALHDELLAISSGMMILLPNARRIGWHDHSYFVDGVDYEFCLSARAHGLRIGVLPGAPGFDHEAEQPDVPRRFMGRTWRLRRYAPGRVLDSLSAYARLGLRSVRRLDAKAFGTVARSASIFLLGQLLARVPLRRAD